MRIAFLDVSTKLRHVRELKKRARGGMVTSLFQVTDYLSSQGHDVDVLSDIERPGRTKSGTHWRKEPRGQYDVLVTNRGTGDGYAMVEAKARVLWTHDLPHSGFIPDPRTIRAFDCTVFMSKYAERIWRTFYKTIGKSVRIPNGVDKKQFYPRQKRQGYLIFASAPNRGLDKLPLILDSVRARISGHVYLRAFSHLASLHPNEGEDSFDYTSVDESSVELIKPLPQEAFANEMGKAQLLVMPSAYPEICSNVILQALACGTPVITTGNLGSAGEWIKHKKNGMLTTYQPHDYMVHTVQVVRNLVDVLENESLYSRLMKGAMKTRVLTWDQIGQKWNRLLSRYS